MPELLTIKREEYNEILVEIGKAKQRGETLQAEYDAAIAKIAELERELESARKERDDAREMLDRIDRNEKLREGFAEWRKRQ